MLSGARRAQLQPLAKACRRRGKTPPEELRRTLSAILWRHQNGARWRAIPQELGPLWQAAQVFIRWAHAGVWERLLIMAQQRGVRLGMVFGNGANRLKEWRAVATGYEKTAASFLGVLSRAAAIDWLKR